jgi:immunoglobulin-binding protein 1
LLSSSSKSIAMLINDMQTIRKRRRQAHVPEDAPSDFDLIASLLPSPSIASDDDGDDTEDILREATLTLLRLMYIQTQSQLGSLDQELTLLRSALRRAPDDAPTIDHVNADLWRLDAPLASSRDGPMLDPSGKVNILLFWYLFLSFIIIYAAHTTVHNPTCRCIGPR